MMLPRLAVSAPLTIREAANKGLPCPFRGFGVPRP